MPPKLTPIPLLCFFLAFTLISAALWASENWIEVRSAHFTVYTPASEKEARNIANQFEQIRVLFHGAFPKLRTNPAQPIAILAVKGEKGMKELLPEQYEVKGHLHAAGMYQEGFDKHYVILQLDVPGDNPYHSLYHEYTHALMHLNFSHLPLWLDEGLAEYLGSASLGDKKSRIGTVDPGYLYVLQSNSLLPIETLLAVDHSSPYYNESNRASVFYAESWALVHYLMLDPEARQKQLLQHFLESWSQSHDQMEAARQTFGDLKKFGQVISSYVRQGQFYNALINNPNEAADKQLASRPVSPAEVIALRGDFFVHHNRLDAGKPLLEEAEKLDPSLALPHTSLALLYFHTQEPQKMRKEANEAIRLGDNGFFPLYLLAGGETSRDRSIEELKKCIELNSRFAPAYDLLAQIYSSSPTDQKEAISSSVLAVKMNPTDLQYSAHLTQLLLNNNRDADAKVMADRIAKAAATPEEKEMASDLTARVANHKDVPGQIMGTVQVRTADSPDSGVPRQDNDRPPGARRQMLGVDGTVASVDCSKAPEISLTVDGSGGFIAYHVADAGKIAIRSLVGAPTPSCTEWTGHKVKLWIYLTPGSTSPGEVRQLEFQ
jgi:tetratricopeptide (TPR) repeat protein